jgi:hypothetical protein
LAERRSIHLDQDDVVAAAQILSWIARPNRPESGVKVLNHWYHANQKKLGRPIPPLPFDLMKPNRIETQFIKLQADCLIALEAGQWFNVTILRNCPHPWFESYKQSVTRLSHNRAEHRQTDKSNELRDVWIKRKPVLHLCLSAGNALGRWLQERDLFGFGLAGAMIEPTWVDEAVEWSEKWARSIPNQIEFENTIRFHR